MSMQERSLADQALIGHAIPPLAPSEPINIVPTLEHQEANKKYRDLLQISANCFIPDSQGRIYPSVNHTLDADAVAVPALEYFNEYSGDPDRLEELFASDGRWVHQMSVNPLNMDVDQLGSFLIGSNQLIYELCEMSPDGHSEEGYNRHGYRHIKRVMRDTREFLETAGASEDAVVRGVFAAGMHDIGYMFAKEAHSLVAANMIPVIFQGLSEKPIEIDGRTLTELDLIQRIVANHDTDVLRASMTQWSRLPAEKRLEAMRGFLHPEGLALLLADKKDIGRDRISWNVRGHGVKRDKHAEVNFLGHNVDFGDFGDKLLWKLEFDPEINERDKQKYPTWAKRLSEEIEAGSYRRLFQHWTNLFWEIYTGRTITMVEAALALRPDMKGVEIQFADKKGGLYSEYFDRENLDRDIARVREFSPQRSGPMFR